MRLDLPEVTNTVEKQSIDSSNISNSFGSISLFQDADTTTRIELPMQKGFSTLEVTPEDLLNEIDTTANQSASQKSSQAEDTTTYVSVDTLQQKESVVETQETINTSPFTEFDEKVFRINYTKIGQIENGWMFWTLLASLVVFGITKIVFHKGANSLFSHTFNFSFAQKEFHKAGENSQLASFILQCLFAFNAGLFAFFALKVNLNWEEIPTTQAILCTGILTIGILLLYFFKKMFYYFLSGVFDRREYAYECVFNIYLFNRVLGICLYPIVIALAFVSSNVISPNLLLNIGYILIGLFFAFRIYREIQISLKNKISIFYIFLYFCTLEILPILLLVKILSGIVLSEFNIL
ncbi:MAG: DUF4271 domain-containing protein [Bacteroidales bacterium]|nr:DUF4271 domain-containing protein [Bacteroidales bacterium]